MSAPQSRELVPAIDESPLALSELTLLPEGRHAAGDSERDSLLFVVGGSGSIAFGSNSRPLAPGAASLVLAGEDALLEAAAESELIVICATVDSETDLHAPMGTREILVRLDSAGSEKATGARSFQILFGPHNGSNRATLFAGFIPPGKAPWHYHLYDEVVWVPAGPGRLHSGGTTEELGAGSAFRLRPRQVHIVENLSVDETMTVIGIFAPAGSPSAAYLTQEIAAEYRFAG